MKIWLTILTIFFSFLLGITQVLACSCAPTLDPLTSKERATAVFVGQVTEIKSPKIFSGSTDNLSITFNVSGSWKGPNFQTLKIHTPASSAACGVNLELGKEYLVYAQGPEDFLQINLCDRLIEISDAYDDFNQLGEGVTANTLSGLSNYYLAVQSLGIIIFILILWLVIINKKNKS